MRGDDPRAVERQRIADRLSREERLTYEQSLDVADRILEKRDGPPR
jgi:hypothetical protein